MTAHRENSVRRRPPFRHIRLRILVVCGGRRTEPAYLDALKRARGNPAVVVTVVPSGAAPTKLVAHAAERRAGASEVIDEAWCVVDVDDFDLAEAEELATRLDVRLAQKLDDGSTTGPNPSSGVWKLADLIGRRAR